jgi:hypothetical protein
MRAHIKRKKLNMSEDQVKNLASQLNYHKNNLQTNVKNLYDFIQKQYNVSGETSLNVLMKKAKKYAQKFNVKPDEVKYFKIHYDSSLKQKGVVTNDYSNDVAKQLGSLQPGFVTEGNTLQVDDKDKHHLEKIFTIHAATKMDYGTAYYHYNSYTHLAPHVMNTRFNPFAPGHSLNINNFIHPVLVALGAIKVNSIDQRFLLSNMASLISNKVKSPENTGLATRPDYSLFYDMTSDPNSDVACDNNVWADLEKRCDIQACSRYMINSLRNGNVYDVRNMKLITELNSCRMSVADAPYLLGFQDEGAVVRRLFRAMSFRPIWLQNSTAVPYPGVVPAFAQHHQAFRTPMINVYPPAQFPNGQIMNNAALPNGAMDLLSGLRVPQLIIENGRAVPRNTNIMHVEDVLVFNVHRNQHVMKPHHFNANMLPMHLPLASIPYQRLNDYTVEAPQRITAAEVATKAMHVNAEDFFLLAVVCKETINGSNKMISPIQSTVLFGYDNDGALSNVYHYRPLMVTRGMNGGNINPTTNVDFRPFIHRDADNYLRGTATVDGGDDLKSYVETHGTVFIYAQRKKDINGNHHF